MNIYKNLLFLHGHVLDPRIVDDPGERYAEGYGHRVASARFFPSLGRGRQAGDAQRREPAPRLDEVCTAGGCG
jgi:hypothetical protein